jgi:hypothetical protein
MNPVEPMHWSNLAKAQKRLGAVVEAADSFRRAQSLHADALSSSGRLESARGSSSGSSSSSSSSSSRGGGSSAGGAVLKAPKAPHRRMKLPRDAKTIIDEAIAVAEGGDLDAALELFQEVRVRGGLGF